jgi:predicted transcriptional regulator
MTEKSEFHLPFNKLYADQLVIEVISYMQSCGQDQLPIYQDDHLLGIISYSEIINFLHHKPENNLFYHKLNYTIESLFVLKNRYSQWEFGKPDRTF